MYNERKDSFSIRDIVIQVLFVVLFVFILIWLFPTKGSIDDKLSKLDEVNTKFDVLTNRIFNENLQTMKEAAISYYTTPRLPKKVNDYKKMTLGEMLNEKLLIEFKDANNKSCDKKASYVQITKLEDEYLLKVNLSCTDNDAYILVHLGCYNYCNGNICENKDKPASAPVVNKKPNDPTPSNPTPSNPKPDDPKPNDPTPSNPTPDDPKPDDPKPDNPKPDNPKPDNPKPELSCVYYYEKTIYEEKWSNWSDWSTTEVTKTNDRQVESKTESKSVEKDVLIGYKKTTYRDMSSPITKDVQVQVGTVSASYCKSYVDQYTKTGQKKYEWIDQGTSYYSNHPQNDAYTKYDYVGSTTVDCQDCYNGVLYIYRKYSLQVYDVVAKGSVCSAYGTVSAPVYITVPKIIGYNTYTKTQPVYEKRTGTVNTKYYRFKTKTTTSYIDKKTSKYENDKTLISQGYVYKGKNCK